MGEMLCDLAKEFYNVNHKSLFVKKNSVEFKDYVQFGQDHI